MILAIPPALCDRIVHVTALGIDGDWHPLLVDCTALLPPDALTLGKHLLTLGNTPAFNDRDVQARCYSLLRHYLLDKRVPYVNVVTAIIATKQLLSSIRNQLVDSICSHDDGDWHWINVTCTNLHVSQATVLLTALRLLFPSSKDDVLHPPKATSRPKRRIFRCDGWSQ